MNAKGVLWVAMLAAAAGYFGNEWMHRPRYTLAGGNGGIAYRINTETGVGDVCVPTRDFDLRCGVNAANDRAAKRAALGME